MRRSRVLLLWGGMAAVCALATVGGFALADAVSDEVQAGIMGFAAGALLVMLVDSMVPDAHAKAEESTGLATVLGFAVAAWLAFAAQQRRTPAPLVPLTFVDRRESALDEMVDGEEEGLIRGIRLCEVDSLEIGRDPDVYLQQLAQSLEQNEAFLDRELGDRPNRQGLEETRYLFRDHSRSELSLRSVLVAHDPQRIDSRTWFPAACGIRSPGTPSGAPRTRRGRSR